MIENVFEYLKDILYRLQTGVARTWKVKLPTINIGIYFLVGALDHHKEFYHLNCKNAGSSYCCQHTKESIKYFFPKLFGTNILDNNSIQDFYYLLCKNVHNDLIETWSNICLVSLM